MESRIRNIKRILFNYRTSSTPALNTLSKTYNKQSFNINTPTSFYEISYTCNWLSITIYVNSELNLH